MMLATKPSAQNVADGKENTHEKQRKVETKVRKGKKPKDGEWLLVHS